ncbi:hypothetical protein HY68_18765 [Streptomyces sp. AcH 505]|uniref:hypothetical protein n=1 Tax=Streptomyces sp. AcH 505 TaxID=352211 RepID=UPI0005923630|nr:hypothetical protein HY68_18765 [Streptomyces sp. AcH 505]
MRQRVVRLTLVAGVTVLALLLLVAMCGGGGKGDGSDGPGSAGGSDGSGGPTPASGAAPGAAPATRLTVPPSYDTGRGWDIAGVSPDYALAATAGTVASLERSGADRFRLRTLDYATGKPRWTGAPWRPLFAADRYPDRFPGLLSVTKGAAEYVATWSYGKLEPRGTTPSDSVVSLDVYDAADGSRRHVEVPWSGDPTVSADGPGILITDGRATSAVVDPADGSVTKVPQSKLGYPKDCPGCRRLTEVRGVTAKGLLVGGDGGFWVRGGWSSRTVAPAGADPATGKAASTAAGYVLAKWQRPKSAKDAATHEIWALHDASTGKAVARVSCRKPAIEPGDDPRLLASPGGHFLIAGRLAFDVDARTGRCFEEPDGTAPLTLTAVTDYGTAYGAKNALSVPEAAAGSGIPFSVDLAAGTPEALAANVRLPVGEAAGVGLFRWTDARDVPHLTGYPERG